MPIITIVVHGTSVTAEHVGGGPLLNVSGIAWTDVVGLRQGWGTTFRGKAGASNWFHFSIPAQQVRGSSLVRRVTSIFVDLEVQGSVRATSFHLWSGPRPPERATRIFNQDGLSVTSRFGLDTSGHLPIPVLMPVGISVGVRFDQEGQITFFSAGADLDVS